MAAMVYTYGACVNDGQDERAIGGIGVYWPNFPDRCLQEPFDGLQTARRAQIMATCRAINQASSLDYTEMTIYLDSMYVIDGAAAKDSPKRLEGREKDAKAFEKLWTAMRKMTVNFEWIPDTDNPANNLAKQAILSRREPINRQDSP